MNIRSLGETVMHPMLEFGLIMLQYGLYVVGGGLAVIAVVMMWMDSDA